jgi:two-component system sensor histidine kinase NreB
MVRRSDGRAMVQVADEGRGFDPVEVGPGRAGLGLWNMRERAQEIGGDIDIRSAIGAGTQVTISVPLAEQRNGT